MSAVQEIVREVLAGSELLAMPWAGAAIAAVGALLLGCVIGGMVARRTPLGGAHCAGCGHRLDDRQVSRELASGDVTSLRCPECGASLAGVQSMRWAARARGVGLAWRAGAVLVVLLALVGVGVGMAWPLPPNGFRADRPPTDDELDALVDQVVGWQFPSTETTRLVDKFRDSDTARRRRIVERLSAAFAELDDSGWRLATRDVVSGLLGRIFAIEAYSDGRGGAALWGESPLDEAFLGLVTTVARRPVLPVFVVVDDDASDEGPLLGIDRGGGSIGFTGLRTSLRPTAIDVDGESVELIVPERRTRRAQRFQSLFRVPPCRTGSKTRTLRIVWTCETEYERQGAPPQVIDPRVAPPGARTIPGRATPAPNVIIDRRTIVTEQRLRLDETGLVSERTTTDPRHVGWTAEADRWSLQFVKIGGGGNASEAWQATRDGALQFVELTIRPVWFTDAVVCGVWTLEQDGRTVPLAEMLFLPRMNPYFGASLAARVDPPFDPDRPMALRFQSAPPTEPSNVTAIDQLERDAREWPGELILPTWEGSLTVPIEPGVRGPRVSVTRRRAGGG